MFGGNPPHDVVFAGVPVDILDDGLGLTHTTHSVQCLGQHGGRSVAGLQQSNSQLVEQFLAADEIRVPQWHRTPDLRLTRQSPTTFLRMT